MRWLDSGVLAAGSARQNEKAAVPAMGDALWRNFARRHEDKSMLNDAIRLLRVDIHICRAVFARACF